MLVGQVVHIKRELHVFVRLVLHAYVPHGVAVQGLRYVPAFVFALGAEPACERLTRSRTRQAVGGVDAQHMARGVGVLAEIRACHKQRLPPCGFGVFARVVGVAAKICQLSLILPAISASMPRLCTRTGS